MRVVSNTSSVFNLRSKINRTRTEAGFCVDAQIEQFILTQVGE